MFAMYKYTIVSRMMCEVIIIMYLLNYLNCNGITVRNGHNVIIRLAAYFSCINIRHALLIRQSRKMG